MFSRFLRFVNGVIGGIIAGIGISLFISTTLVDAGLGSLPLWQIVLFAILLMYAAIAIHEAGHWVTGIFVRFTTVRISVGPLMINRRNGKTSLLWYPGPMLLGGLTTMVPDGDQDLPGRFGWFVAGGPLASIITAFVCLAAMPTLPIGDTKVIVVALGCISLFFGVFALLPMNTGIFHSDGARLLMLYRGGEAVERLVAMLRISSESHAGVRPRDWSADALAALEHDPGGEDDAALASVRYAYAIDTQNLDAARSILDRQLSVANKNNPGFRANWCLEAALFAAHHDNNAIIARAWQKKGKRAVFVDAVAHQMVEAEILLAEKRFPKARQAHEKALAAVPRIKFLPTGYPITEKLDDLRARIDEAKRKELSEPTFAAALSDGTAPGN